MDNTCWTCEYKRLAREAIEDLRVVSDCIGFLDMDVKRQWRAMADDLLDRLRKLHHQQQQEKAGNPPGPEGLTADEIVAVEVLSRSVLSTQP